MTLALISLAVVGLVVLVGVVISAKASRKPSPEATLLPQPAVQKAPPVAYEPKFIFPELLVRFRERKQELADKFLGENAKHEAWENKLARARSKIASLASGAKKELALRHLKVAEEKWGRGVSRWDDYYFNLLLGKLEDELRQEEKNKVAHEGRVILDTEVGNSRHDEWREGLRRLVVLDGKFFLCFIAFSGIFDRVSGYGNVPTGNFQKEKRVLWMSSVVDQLNEEELKALQKEGF